MARARVKLIDSGMRALLSDPGVAADLASRAESVAEAARASAPVETGAYRDSIHVEADHTDRVVARVVADVPYATRVEAGHGTLTSALDAAAG